MFRRALLAASLGLIAFAVAPMALAVTGTDLPRWSALAVPSDKRLPTVTVTLGYPGHYIPADNSPIELRLSGTSAFDGYIGFRFGVGRAITRDIPVLMRAKADRDRAWSFPTFVQLTYYYSAYDNLAVRELVIDWYDRSGRLLARRSVGAPPWSAKRRPLRIVGPTEDRAQVVRAARILLTPDLLGSEAQWYRGFSSIAIPVDLWLDLPSKLRETIFNSEARILFFIGLPRPDQKLAALDKAVIPVIFEPGEGQVEIPSIYRRDREASRRTAMSWHARPDAEGVGTDRNPYVVVATSAASRTGSMWAFEEHAFTENLPITSAQTAADYRRATRPSLTNKLARWVGLLHEFRPAVLVLAVGIASILLWISFRRRAHVFVPAIALIAGMTVLAMRDRVRPIEGSRIVETWTEAWPGVIVHSVDDEVFGTSPLPSSRAPSVSENWIAWPLYITEDAEIRERSTLPGHGSMFYASSPWDMTSRARLRYELGQAARVRLLALSDEELRLEYEVDELTPVKLLASWTSNGVWRFGQATLQGKQRGVAKIETRRGVAAEDVENWRLSAFRHLRGGENVRLWFVDDDATNIKVVEWAGVFSTPKFIPYFLTFPIAIDVKEPTPWTFVFPALPDKGGEIYLHVVSRVAPVRMELAGELGTIPIGPADRMTPAKPTSNVSTYRLPVSRLASISPPRYPLRLTVIGMFDGLSKVEIHVGKEPHE